MKDFLQDGLWLDIRISVSNWALFFFVCMSVCDERIPLFESIFCYMFEVVVVKAFCSFRVCGRL